MKVQLNGKSMIIIAVILLLAGSLPRRVRSAPMNSQADRNNAELMACVRNAFGYQPSADDAVAVGETANDGDVIKCMCCLEDLRGGDKGQDSARLPCGHYYHAGWYVGDLTDDPFLFNDNLIWLA